ncbi:MAG: DUF5683 domain-containing protein [Prevotellaceae bacterium]|jgi:hypothetical protein|nr:DUF5683 domain-containing protein [Prevotellaceae bacterium]
MVKKLAVILLLFLCLAHTLQAQTKSTAEVQHDSLSVAKMWAISLVAPSFSQAYNHQYWKMPIVLGGIGGMLYGGIKSNSLYHDAKNDFNNGIGSQSTYERYQRNRNLFFAGASAFYMYSMLDGVASYRFDNGQHSPSKAAIYSTLIPGLGQIYNEKYWKLPLVYGGFMVLGYLIQSNNFRYKLYRDAYNDQVAISSIPDKLSPEYLELADNLGIILNTPADRLRTYRDRYRRDRDFYIILTILFYGLNIIDATVDAHFYTYDVSNDLSFNITPVVHQYANSNSVYTGFNLSFTF